ncbi:MAG: hypothetical protein ABIT58_09820 [Ferruginibacter sp.]
MITPLHSRVIGATMVTAGSHSEVYYFLKAYAGGDPATTICPGVVFLQATPTIGFTNFYCANAGRYATP